MTDLFVWLVIGGFVSTIAILIWEFWNEIR